MLRQWDFRRSLRDRTFAKLQSALRALCLPPYGANIASAGLALGVFIAPRYKKLIAVRGGQQFAISQLLQDGMFKGKFIDLNALNGVDLISLGEESSEWEKLFDEWEIADSHLERCNYWARAIELKKRIPVPPLHAYREVRLHEQARASFAALKRAEKEENEALDKVEHGLRMADAGKIAWGAADLLKLQERMAAEPRAWTAAQSSEIQPHYDRARQAVIMHFREWLDRQAPHGDTLDVVSAFNTKMINVIGADLKKIGLDEQHTALDARTRELLRQAHTITDARQLLRDVDSLISRATIAARTIRMAELRSLIEQGKGYAAKLAGMSARVSLPEIGTARAQLATLLAKLKQATDEVAKRGKQIWKKKLQSAEDIGQLLSEVESLINTYEAS